MNVRPFQSSDYEDVSRWWLARPPWQPLPQDFLSPLGFVAESGGIKLCAIWLWLTGTSFCVIDYLVSNPDAPLRARYKGMGAVIDAAKAAAKRAGAKAAFASLQNEGLERFFEKHGFEITDRKMVNLLARL